MPDPFDQFNAPVAVSDFPTVPQQAGITFQVPREFQSNPVPSLAVSRLPNVTIAHESSYWAAISHTSYAPDVGSLGNLIKGFEDSFHSVPGIAIMDSVDDYLTDQVSKNPISEDEYAQNFGEGKWYEGMSWETATKRRQRQLVSAQLQAQMSPTKYPGMIAIGGLAAGFIDPANALLMIPGLGPEMKFGLTPVVDRLTPALLEKLGPAVRAVNMADHALRIGPLSGAVQMAIIDAASTPAYNFQGIDISTEQHMMNIAGGALFNSAFSMLHGVSLHGRAGTIMEANKWKKSLGAQREAEAANNKIVTPESIAADPNAKAMGLAAEVVNGATKEQINTSPSILAKRLSEIDARLAEIRSKGDKLTEAEADELIKLHQERISLTQNNAATKFTTQEGEPETFDEYKQKHIARQQTDTPQTPQEDASITRAKALDAELEDISYGHRDERASPDERWMGALWEEVFGTEVRFIPPENSRGFSGVYIAKGNANRVYIETGRLIGSDLGKNNISMMLAAGHETGHQIMATRPELWRKIVNTIMDMPENKKLTEAFDHVFADKNKDGAWANLSEQGRMDETMANVFGLALEDPAFWRQLHSKERETGLHLFSLIKSASNRLDKSQMSDDPRSAAMAETLARFIAAAGKGTDGEFNPRINTDDFYKPYFENREGWYFDKLRNKNSQDLLSAMFPEREGGMKFMRKSDEDLRAELNADSIISDLVHITGAVVSGRKGISDLDTVLHVRTGIRLNKGTDPRVWAFNTILKDYVRPENMESFRQAIIPRYTAEDFKAAGLQMRFDRAPNAKERWALNQAKLKRLVKGQEFTALPDSKLATMTLEQNGSWTMRIHQNNEALGWKEFWNDQGTPEETGRLDKYAERDEGSNGDEGHSKNKEFLIEHGKDLEEDFAHWLGYENYGPKAARLLEDWLGDRSLEELHDILSVDSSVAWRRFHRDVIEQLQDRTNSRFPVRKDGKGYVPFDGSELPQYFKASRELGEAVASGDFKVKDVPGITPVEIKEGDWSSALHRLYSMGHTENLNLFLTALEEASANKGGTVEPSRIDPSKPARKIIVMRTAEGKPRIFSAEMDRETMPVSREPAEPSTVADVTKAEEGENIDRMARKAEGKQPEKAPYYGTLKRLLGLPDSEEQLGLGKSADALRALAKDPTLIGAPRTATETFWDAYSQRYQEVMANLPKYMNLENFVRGFMERHVGEVRDTWEKVQERDPLKAASLQDRMAAWQRNVDSLQEYLQSANDPRRSQLLMQELIKNNPRVAQIIEQMALEQAYTDTHINYTELPEWENMSQMAGRDMLSLQDTDISPVRMKANDKYVSMLQRVIDPVFDMTDEPYDNRPRQSVYDTQDVAKYMAGDKDRTSAQEGEEVARQNDADRKVAAIRAKDAAKRLEEDAKEHEEWLKLPIQKMDERGQKTLSDVGFVPEIDMETNEPMPITVDKKTATAAAKVAGADPARYIDFAGRYNAIQEVHNRMARQIRAYLGYLGKGGDLVEISSAAKEIADYHFIQNGGDAGKALDAAIDELKVKKHVDQLAETKRLQFGVSMEFIYKHFGMDGIKTALDGILRPNAQKMASMGIGPLASFHAEYDARPGADVQALYSFLNESGVKELWKSNQLMEALSDYNDTGKSSDPVIKELHRLIQLTRRYQIGRMNAAGARIRMLDGYFIQQIHNPERIINAGFDTWANAVKPVIDWAKMEQRYGNGISPDKFLESMYADIVKRAGEPFNPDELIGNLANTTAHHREIFFNSTKDAFHYDMSFGSGNTASSIFTQFARRSEYTVLMENMGANYKLAANDLVDFVRKNAKSAHRPLVDQPGFGNKLNAAISNAANLLGADNEWRIKATLGKLTGDLDHPADIQMARLGKGLRNWGMGIAGWTSGISSLTDISHVVRQLRFSGVPLENVYAEVSKAYAAMARDPQYRNSLIGHGVAMQSMIHAMSKMDSGGMLYRLSAKASDAAMELGQLDRVTRWNQMAFADVLSQGYGRAAEALRKGGAMDPGMKHYLELHGISEAEFREMAQYAHDQTEGLPGMRLFPDMIPARGLREKLGKLYRSASTNASIEPAISTRAYLTGGFQAGTPEGEAMRCLGMFKAYPMAILTKTMGEFNNGYAGFQSANMERAIWVATAVVLAGGVVSIKNVLGGREPLNPLNPKQWTPTNLARVVSQAGAGPMSMLDQFTSLQGVGGPVFGTAMNLGSAAISGSSYKRINAGISLVPGANFPTINQGSKILLAHVLGNAYEQSYRFGQAYYGQKTGTTSIGEKSFDNQTSKGHSAPIAK
jgi:hypothetical protein